jgi:hypothetical protein
VILRGLQQVECAAHRLYHRTFQVPDQGICGHDERRGGSVLNSRSNHEHREGVYSLVGYSGSLKIGEKFHNYHYDSMAPGGPTANVLEAPDSWIPPRTDQRHLLPFATPFRRVPRIFSLTPISEQDILLIANVPASGHSTYRTSALICAFHKSRSCSLLMP